MSELNEKLATAWEGFTKGDWQNEVNVRDFIQKNYTPYEGDESFLAGATDATTKLWDSVMEGVKLENRTHAPVDFDTSVASTITSHDAGYINKALEKIVGLQTEAPLKRAIIPFGGIKMVEGSCKAYNRELDPMLKKIFTEYRKTHNQGVFDVYTKDILNCRKSGVLTGLPDAYGRGDSKNASVTVRFGCSEKINGSAPTLPSTVQNRTTIRKPSRDFSSRFSRRVGHHSREPIVSATKKVCVNARPAPSR